MYELLTRWYMAKRGIPSGYVLLVDLCLLFLAGMAAYIFVEGLAYTVARLGTVLHALAIYLVCYLPGICLFGTSTGVIRHTTTSDLLRLALAVGMGVAIVMLLRLLLPVDHLLIAIRFRTLVLQALIAVLLMSALRLGVKLVYEMYMRYRSQGGVYGYDAECLIDLEMNDLLSRDPITVDMQRVRQTMSGRRIMVTGAAGSIGSELVRLLASCRPAELVLIDIAETPLHDVRLMMERQWPDVPCSTIVTSICHRSRMESIFRTHRPEIIFHTAAYKHVPMLEDNPVESVLNNIDGTRKLADLAVEFGAKKFVMVSTDKAVNPTNVMGCSKRICEMYCHALNTTRRARESGCRFITTRFGNVLGSNGSVIPLFREQIRRGGPVTVTHPEIVRYFMLIPEACSLVLEAATMGEGGEIFVFDMGNPVRIVDIARRMIDLSGRRGISIEYVGLRPGEKLYEEVLCDSEKVRPTRHTKIKVAAVRPSDYDKVAPQTDRLVSTALTFDDAAVLALMREMVPEYNPSQSHTTAINKSSSHKNETSESDVQMSVDTPCFGVPAGAVAGFGSGKQG